jgi:ABC-type sugar transport system permease subunit
MLAYPILQFLLFWFYVNIDSLLLTFKGFSWSTGQYEYIGLGNYQRVFHDLLNNESTRRTIRNSLFYLPVTSFIILPLSLIFSYFLYKKIPFSNFFRVVYFLPSIMPIVVLTMTFSFLFDSNLGPVNSTLKALFSMDPASIPSWFGSYPTNQIMIYIYCIWVGLGFNILLLSGAIARIPYDLIEYGKLEGINMYEEIKNVVIPLTWPTISTVFILGCTSVFIVMLQPLFLTPDSPYTQTIALNIYNSVVQNGNLSYFTTFGLVVSLIGTPIIMVIRKALNHFYQDVEY